MHWASVQIILILQLAKIISFYSYVIMQKSDPRSPSAQCDISKVGRSTYSNTLR